jgi:hypothetical protein
MRLNRDLAWLVAVVVVMALGIRWLERRASHAQRALPKERGATVIRVGDAFDVKVQGPGSLVFRDHRTRGGLAETARLTVDLQDGDIVRASDMAHLYPKVQLPPNMQTLEIAPGGEVLATSQDGAVTNVGQIMLVPSPLATPMDPRIQDENLTTPGEGGTGRLLMSAAPPVGR